uniref:Uncharacterized protein n=1 Tax=Oryza sativa subsp. japonica TaxID=39947 RepID=Q6H4G0_ORYSJ|nr:hypothetical protein [Oryza sativa Japonica Group]
MSIFENWAGTSILEINEFTTDASLSTARVIPSPEDRAMRERASSVGGIRALVAW